MIQLNCDMPTSCQECRFSVDGWCYALRAEEIQPGQLNYLTRPEWCPFRDTAPRWVRVEDGLPKYGQDVLAARLYGADSDGWAYEVIIAHVCEVRGTNYWNATNVTHWMPLPEPPKEDA